MQIPESLAFRSYAMDQKEESTAANAGVQAYFFFLLKIVDVQPSRTSASCIGYCSTVDQRIRYDYEMIRICLCHVPA